MVDVVEQVFVMTPEVRHVHRRGRACDLQRLIGLIRFVIAILQLRIDALTGFECIVQILILQHLDEQVQQRRVDDCLAVRSVR